MAEKENVMTVKTALYAAATAGVLAATASAQAPTPPTADVKAAMDKLAWLEGSWKGEGWRLTPTGEKASFSVKEEAVPKLDGVVLTLEGLGWSRDAQGEKHIGHHAFAVLSYDPFARGYRINAFTWEGYQTTATPEVAEGKFRWRVPAGPGVEMRYYTRLGENGEWLEKGERCTGEECVEVMAMRLNKVAGE